VLVGFQGDVKIADFGLAKAKQRLTKTLTGLLKGEPQYMAPEQAQTDEIDGRADLFSLGVMLFELLHRAKARGSAKTELRDHAARDANEPPLPICASCARRSTRSW
jgi:serine/threonine protein kinase